MNNVNQNTNCYNPIFIVGTQRCGTTLLASVLSSNPNIVITPETTILFKIQDVLKVTQDARTLAYIFTKHERWNDFSITESMLYKKLKRHSKLNVCNVMNEFYNCFTEVSGKPRWGDNTPGYSEIILKIIDIWPSAYIIHIFRDGRAVAASWLNLSWGPKTIEEAAYRWSKRITKCREDSGCVENFFEVRYEDFVSDFFTELQKICRFISESIDQRMLDYFNYDGPDRFRLMTKNPFWDARKEYHKNILRPPDPSLIDKWRKVLTQSQVEKFQALTGNLLNDLGYELVGQSK